MSRAWLPPDHVTRSYTRQLRAVVAEIAIETERQLRERKLLRLDSWSDDLDALMLYLAEFSISLINPVIIRLPATYAAVSTWNDKQWRLVVKAGTGLEIAVAGSVPGAAAISDPMLLTKRFGMGIDLYRQEPWLAELQKNWVAQNTSLIKSVPSQYLAKVEQVVRAGVINGTASREIAKQIKDVSGVTDRRAKIIARDQVNKANGELTRYRQQDLGVDQYKWVTAHDERVRGNPSGRFPGAVPSHYARDGKTFSWSEAPSGGHPGMAILCRCFASPVFDD